MSTSSTATASAEIGPTLCNNINIGYQVCVLVATWGNDIALNPSSFQEENVIESCRGLGQEHLEGVVWLPDTEVVLA